jgi:hypothetical protein
MGKSNLVEILGLQSTLPGLQTPSTSMYCHLPWVGTHAFLHTIFRPADRTSLRRLSIELKIPEIWQEALAHQNGANLYLNALYIYGALDQNRLKDRSGTELLPFSIGECNEESGLSSDEEWLQIGSYGYSGAMVLLSRTDGCVKSIDQSGRETLSTWPNVHRWLEDEVRRLSLLFSAEGRLLTDERFTEPRRPSKDVL